MLVLHDMNSLKQGFYLFISWFCEVECKLRWTKNSTFEYMFQNSIFFWALQGLGKRAKTIHQFQNIYIFIYFKPHLKIVVVYMYA